MTDLIVSQLLAVIAALAALSMAWACDRQGMRHAEERELWRAERQVLQARALKPMPSPRRPAESSENTDKMAELKRIASRPVQLDVTDERRPVIIHTDF